MWLVVAVVVLYRCDLVWGVWRDAFLCYGWDCLVVGELFG